ncbi:MAG TPA: OmpA family protein, partial [Bryobacteraceae bacterium]|nr:OmpA family protein [Bryobacteraceae bacterium]
MTQRKLAALLIALLLACGALFAQGEGPQVNASKDDWEEINFETNSAKISDGFPTLLRMAELLKNNPGWKLKVEGHADSVGSHPFNDKLAMNRAKAVKAFLEKYGANPNQTTASGQGKRAPKVNNDTKEGRFVNRRVQMTLTDDKGNVIKANAGAGDTVSAFEKHAKQTEECCNLILKRLDKLEEILAELRQLKDDHRKILDELAALKRAGTGPAPAPAPAPAPGPSSAQLSQLA